MELRIGSAFKPVSALYTILIELSALINWQIQGIQQRVLPALMRATGAMFTRQIKQALPALYAVCMLFGLA